ncbi:MAG: FeoA family protein [Planctomycetota bacterium]
MPDAPPPTDAPPAIGLDRLKAGQTAVILRMDEADHAMLIRLKTMGMHPGRAVRVLRQGSRLVVTCGGTRIGISAAVAKHIRVTPTAS